MPKFFRHLWAAPYDLKDAERQQTVRVAAVLGALLVLLVLAVTGWFAGQAATDPISPTYDVVIIARTVLARVVPGAALMVIGSVGGGVLYQVIENSDLGKRLLIWHGKDCPEVKAQKTRNAGLLLALLQLAGILGFLLGVLR